MMWALVRICILYSYELTFELYGIDTGYLYELTFGLYGIDTGKATLFADPYCGGGAAADASWTAFSNSFMHVRICMILSYIVAKELGIILGFDIGGDPGKLE